MNTLLQSQVFFFISSVGFIILGVFVAVFLFYLIRATNTFSRILEQIEDDIDNIGDTTKEMVEDIRDSAVFGFLFRKKRKELKIVG
jgi:large-conductance mechanosensitive channel